MLPAIAACGADFPQLPKLVVRPVPTTNLTFKWDASSSEGIAEYRLYVGGSSGSYTNSYSAGTNLSLTVSNLSRRLGYYVAATATDTYGLQSDFSNELVLTNPAPRTNCVLTITSQNATNIRYRPLNGTWMLANTNFLRFTNPQVSLIYQALGSSTKKPGSLAITRTNL